MAISQLLSVQYKELDATLANNGAYYAKAAQQTVTSGPDWGIKRSNSRGSKLPHPYHSLYEGVYEPDCVAE